MNVNLSVDNAESECIADANAPLDVINSCRQRIFESICDDLALVQNEANSNGWAASQCGDIWTLVIHAPDQFDSWSSKPLHRGITLKIEFRPGRFELIGTEFIETKTKLSMGQLIESLQDFWMNSMLIKACMVSDDGLSGAKSFLENSPPVEWPMVGTTCLHMAAWFGNVGLCEYLIEKGARTDARLGPERHSLCACMDTECSMRTAGFTALHLACMEQKIDALTALCDKGADIDSAIGNAYDSYAPIHVAMRHGSTSACLALLDRGADLLVGFAIDLQNEACVPDFEEIFSRLSCPEQTQAAMRSWYAKREALAALLELSNS